MECHAQLHSHTYKGTHGKEGKEISITQDLQTTGRTIRRQDKALKAVAKWKTAHHKIQGT